MVICENRWITMPANALKRSSKVTEFTSVDLKGLSLDNKLEVIAESINMTHKCVHQMAQANSKAHEEAQVKRHELANEFMKQQADLKTLGEKVTGLSGDVGKIQADREISDGYVKRIAEKLGADNSDSDRRSF
jgi:hypothetical protein